MSTATTDIPVAPIPPASPDPFRYGWRYVKGDEGGNESYRQVPLTLEDVLHPQEGDFIVNTELHNILATYLKLALQAHLSTSKGVVVLGDTRIDWGSPHGWAHGPNVVAFSGVKRWSRHDGTFYLKDCGGRVDLAIEVTSHSTRGNDYGAKKREYYLVGVPQYVIVDVPEKGELGAIQLFGFKAGARQYEPIVPDAKGRIWLETARLWIGVEGERVVLVDEQGNLLPDYHELQAQKAQEMNARLQAEKARADAEKARAEAEKAKRDVESKLSAADDRIKQLEEELRKARPQSS